MGAFVVLGVLVLVTVAAFTASTVLGFIVLAVLLFGLALLGKWGERQKSNNEAAGARRGNKSLRAHASRDRHQPPVPTGAAVQPWSVKLRNFEVAGEFYRTENVTRVFRGHPTQQDEGVELRLPATLVPDPTNPFDPHAVAVYVSREHVGYLAREDAEEYSPALRALAASDRHLEVESRQWARYDTYRRDLYCRITLRLPAPEGITPANAVPASGVVLPTGSSMQVTREDEHMDALSPWLDPEGREVAIATTLHSSVEVRPRSTIELVEVRLDGSRIGVLTATSTSNLMPLVKFLEGQNSTPIVRATLRGNSLKADVTLHVAKAQDVSPSWIQDHNGSVSTGRVSIANGLIPWNEADSQVASSHKPTTE